MKDRIGDTAGKIWRILGEKQNINISNLPKILKEKEEVVYQALGWLAREDKIKYHIKERKAFVSLTHEEDEIFNSAPLGSPRREGYYNLKGREKIL